MLFEDKSVDSDVEDYIGVDAQAAFNHPFITKLRELGKLPKQTSSVLVEFPCNGPVVITYITLADTETNEALMSTFDFDKEHETRTGTESFESSSL